MCARPAQPPPRRTLHRPQQAQAPGKRADAPAQARSWRVMSRRLRLSALSKDEARARRLSARAAGVVC